MKSIIFIVLGIILLSCTAKHKKTQTISVLEDITDSNFLSKPKANTIILQYGLNKDKWQSAKFRYGTITSVGYNQQFEYTLEKEHSLLGNELDRRKKVSDFKSSISNVLSNQKQDSGLKHSSIWQPIVKEIIELQKDSLQTAKLYVFSDLQENSLLFSVYRAKDIRKFQKDKGVIKQLFLKHSIAIKKNLQNVKVIILYQPKNQIEDQKFQQMVVLYKAIFKELGISIEFKANI